MATLDAFIDFARRDTALQERVSHALAGSDQVGSILRIAAQAGFTRSRDEVAASLSGALDEKALESVAGAGFAPVEWFAEQLKTSPKKIDGQ